MLARGREAAGAAAARRGQELGRRAGTGNIVGREI